MFCFVSFWNGPFECENSMDEEKLKAIYYITHKNKNLTTAYLLSSNMLFFLLLPFISLVRASNNELTQLV